MKQPRREYLLDCLEKNKRKIINFIIPNDYLALSIANLPASGHLSGNELVNFLQSFEQLHLPAHQASNFNLFKSASIPKEIISLLSDVCHGKINDYLQEILSNAEIELLMINEIPGNLDSNKELDIKIKLAATVIDKYSGLLQMVIGNKSKLSKKENAIIENAWEVLNSSTSKLRRIHLIYSIINLEKTIEKSMNDKAKNTCFPWLFYTKSKHCTALNELLGNLKTQALSEHEFIGAIFTIFTQIEVIADENERDMVKNEIEKLFISNHLHLDEINFKEYINEFTARAEILKMHWPKPFAIMPADALSPEHLRAAVG